MAAVLFPARQRRLIFTIRRLFLRIYAESDYFFIASAVATATATVAPTMGLLPMPRKPIISTCAGRAGACKLRVGVHTTHGIGHAVGRWGRAPYCPDAGYGRMPPPDATEKYFLPLLDAFLLVGACNRMLEAGGVGGVAGDGASTPSKCMIATPSRTSSQP